MKEKHQTIVKNNARIDIRLKLDKGKVKFFCVNLSLLVGTKYLDVYRVDTAHGYPHEQKFWRSPKPIKIKNGDDYKKLYHEKLDEVEKNYKKCIRWFETAGKINI